MYRGILRTSEQIVRQQPINPQHWLSRGLDLWWLVRPEWWGGKQIIDLRGKLNGSFQGFTNGYGSTTRLGGRGELAKSGTTKYVQATYDGTSRTDGTIMFWFKPSTVGVATDGVFCWAQTATQLSGTPFMLIQNNSGNLKYYVDGNYREVSQTISAGVWYHIAETQISTTSWAFYLNGSQLSTYTSASPPAFRANANVLFWGCGFNAYQDGSYDDFRSYTYGMSANQVRAAWQNSLQGCPGLLNRVQRAFGPAPAAAADDGNIGFRQMLAESTCIV